MREYKSVIAGLIGGLGLFGIYFAILSWVSSLEHALRQFNTFWFLILPLVVGFGIQVGLYVYVRTCRRVKRATAEVTATGGVSTGAMVACCAHHISELLPIIGLSALAGFAERFHIPLMLAGIFANLIGIIFMLQLIKKFSLYGESGLFERLLTMDLRGLMSLSLASAFLIVFLAFFLISLKPMDLREIPRNPDFRSGVEEWTSNH